MMVVAAAAVACGVVSARLTATAVRLVDATVSPAAAAWAACGAVLWACVAARVGLLLSLPLAPVAVVVAPLAVTDWTERRLPDVFTLSAGSATAAAMSVVAAVESSSAVLWLAAGLAAGLAPAGHTLHARGLVPGWVAPVSVWAATVTACALAGAGRLTAAVVAGALATGVILIGHLAGLAGFGDVKMAPMVCCAGWVSWDSFGGLWLAAATACAAVWLSVLIGGLVTVVSPRLHTDGIPLGAFLPGATLAVAVAVAWL